MKEEVFYDKSSLAERYRAKYYFEFVGQEKAVQEIKTFLKEFPKKKAMILYGPAGTGKTSLALAAAKENNLDVLELNSSDLRNRTKLEAVLRPATEQKSLFKKGKLLLVDEVDGVTGTDIGGIPELVKLVSTTGHPMILTCNDVWQSKLSPLRPKCKLVEMKSLHQSVILELLRKICQEEKFKDDINSLLKIAIKSQGDVRAALNDLQSYTLGENVIIDIKEKRDVEDNIFNILRKIFKERGDFLELFDTTSMSLDEILLWIEENIPREYKNEALVKAYHALGNADVFRGRIYKNQSWRFLVYQNIFQSAGISFAKSAPLGGFTKYEKPKRVLKIWMHNQKTLQKKTIAKKFARFAHCSTKRAMGDFQLLKTILKNNDETHKKLKLSEDEIDFLQQ